VGVFGVGWVGVYEVLGGFVCVVEGGEVVVGEC